MLDNILEELSKDDSNEEGEIKLDDKVDVEEQLKVNDDDDSDKRKDEEEE